MKKNACILICLLLTALLLAVTLCSTAAAEPLPEGRAALKSAETFNQQLEILNRIALEHADSLEAGGWETSLTAAAAPGLPDGLIPENWDAYAYTKAEGLPEAMRGHKFIVLYCAGSAAPALAGDLLARFPAEMRAASLAEAEYALIVRWHLVNSGIRYIIPTTSYNRDYEAYAVNLKTGESARFWTERNGAKGSGKMNKLDGDLFSQQELWTTLRAYILGELRHELADGSVLVFGLSSKNCYLKRAELAEGLTDLVIPDEVEGHAVTEIAAGCFMYNETLRAIRLPASLQTIGESAFYHAYALETITLPASLRVMGQSAFQGSSKLARTVVEEGLENLPGSTFRDCSKMACIYLPASLKEFKAAYIEDNTVIYAPEGSYALNWAKEKGYACVACDSPDQMPPVEYIAEGDFEFQLFNGEAAVSRYLGQAKEAVIPSSAGGCPVTRVYSLFAGKSLGISVILPNTVRTIARSFVYGGGIHIYIANPDTAFEGDAIQHIYKAGTITIHAPEGSTAQRYVTERKDKQVEFEPWGEGADPNARSLSDALALAEQLRQSVASFWEECDQKEYARLSRVPDCDMSAPEAAAVLRVPQKQFDGLTLLLGSPANPAAAFAAGVNIQFNLPYADAAAKTAQTKKLDPVADGSCAFVVLCYRTDIVLATLGGDGSAQAALVCSGPEVTKNITPDYVNRIAAQYGLAGQCTVYSPEEMTALLKQ